MKVLEAALRGSVTVPSAQRNDGRASFDAFKGVFITLIVLGHNQLLTVPLPRWNKTLYEFHVWGFLLLPFLATPLPLNRARLADRATRYLIPYAAFFWFTAVLFYALYRRQSPVIDWITQAVVAFFVASSATLDAATGMQLYWFLPTLLTVVVVRGWVHHLESGWRIAAVLFFVLVHGLLGSLPEFAKMYAPFGIFIAAYVLPLGLAFAALWRLMQAAPVRFAVLSSAVCVILIAVSARSEVWVNLAPLRVYTYSDPLKLLIADGTALSACLALLCLSRWYSRSKLICALGRQSLTIYLVHALVYQLLLQISRKLDWIPAQDSLKILLGLAFAVVILAASFVVGKLVHASACVRRFVFPRTWGDWLNGRSLREAT